MISRTKYCFASSVGAAKVTGACGRTSIAASRSAPVSPGVPGVLGLSRWEPAAAGCGPRRKCTDSPALAGARRSHSAASATKSCAACTHTERTTAGCTQKAKKPTKRPNCGSGTPPKIPTIRAWPPTTPRTRALYLVPKRTPRRTSASSAIGVERQIKTPPPK